MYRTKVIIRRLFVTATFCSSFSTASFRANQNEEILDQILTFATGATLQLHSYYSSNTRMPLRTCSRRKNSHYPIQRPLRDRLERRRLERWIHLRLELCRRVRPVLPQRSRQERIFHSFGYLRRLKGNNKGNKIKYSIAIRFITKM